jgi:hypothetical protein
VRADIWSDIGNADHERALRRLHSLSDSLRAIVEQAGGCIGLMRELTEN